MEERKSMHADTHTRREPTEVLTLITYLITVQQVLECTIPIGITCLTSVGMLSTQKLENKTHVLQDIRRMCVDALSLLYLGDARRDKLTYRHELFDPPCIRR